MNNHEAKTVLIIEDSTLLWSSMKRALKMKMPHVRIDCVTTLEEWIEYLATHRVDLIICDYHLPNLRNGFELWESEVMRRLKTPFLMISGMGTESYLNFVKDRKTCPAFLAKPFRLDHLIQAVQEMISINGEDLTKAS